MKIRTDFVTNSSSSSYIFIGFFSKDLLNYLYQLIDEGYTYRYDGVETMSDKGYIASNSGTEAVVDALTFIEGSYNDPSPIGFQIEKPDWNKYETDRYADDIMRFLDPASMTPEKKEEIYQKLCELTENEDDIRYDYGTYSTDSGFARHFSGKDRDALLCEITNKMHIISCNNKELQEVVLFNRISGIRTGAFENMKELRLVDFKSGFQGKKIEFRAFQGCEALEKVEIWSTSDRAKIAENEMIGDKTFKSFWSWMRQFDIGAEAFLNCKSLREIDLLGCKSIGSRAFEGCESLIELRFENLLSISKVAFKGCISLKKVYLPETVVKISPDAFADCPELVIYAREGSFAEEYAKKKKINFVKMN